MRMTCRLWRCRSTLLTFVARQQVRAIPIAEKQTAPAGSRPHHELIDATQALCRPLGKLITFTPARFCKLPVLEPGKVDEDVVLCRLKCGIGQLRPGSGVAEGVGISDTSHLLQTEKDPGSHAGGAQRCFRGVARGLLDSLLARQLLSAGFFG